MGRLREKSKDEKEKRKTPSGSEQNGGNQPQGQNKKFKTDGKSDMKFTGSCNFCGIIGHKFYECRRNPNNKGKA